MGKHTKAQIHALDRVMYLLEESSFRQLQRGNEHFDDFVEELYARLEREVNSLSRHVG
jgi:signal-transduction protein with cAMP-binding, CBS, and nucleotidyltransferase domain